MNDRLQARGLRMGYGARTVVHDLDLSLADGRVTVIVGANACGKSTLLRGIARIVRPESGVVLLDGNDIHRLPTRQVARTLGLLPQQPVAPDAISVADLVGRGRHPHLGWMRSWGPDDEQAVAEALAATGTADLAARRVDELSGGQRQRVWIAMALAQRTDLLLLDEPTSFLDLAHQVDVLDLLLELNRTRGTTVAMVLHDLNMAARYADVLVVMGPGRLLAEGPPAEVLTPAVVEEAFGLEAVVIEDPVAGCPLVVPVSRLNRGSATLAGGSERPS